MVPQCVGVDANILKVIVIVLGANGPQMPIKNLYIYEYMDICCGLELFYLLWL